MMVLIRLLLGLSILLGLPTYATTYYDDVGNDINLNTPAQRIVSLSPAITENLFSIGAGNRVVGVSANSDFPSEALKLPIISDYQSINLEALARLKPDVVIAWQGGNSPAQIEALKQLGIPIYIQKIETLAEIPTSLMRMAHLTGTEAASSDVILNAYQRIPLLTQAPTPHLNGFYQVWHAPLMTINHSSWINDAMNRCGIDNPYQDLPLITPTVAIEDVLQHNPSIIVSASPHAQDDGSLNHWKRWPQLAAVKSSGLIYTDADAINRPTLRTLVALESLCDAAASVRMALH